MRPGCEYRHGESTFAVWAPLHDKVWLELVTSEPKLVEMQKDEEGYFSVTLRVPADAGYYFVVNGKQLPDPASHFQPEGIDAPSSVVDHASFEWTDQHWKGLPFEELIIYELHTGTFTEAGTFESMIARLDDLAALGVNAIELMPVAQFSGERNWGYDAVFPYAVQNSYGGPDGLKRLINVCHNKGIAVILDVVYNHLGAEGNVFAEYGPYFTDRYKALWGESMNMDGDYCDGVREFFVTNALYWFEHYHIDGLRLDAIHAVYDSSATPFWKMLTAEVSKLSEKLGRPLYMIAESDLNSPHVVKSYETGGWNFTAQWLDDFHHILYVLLHEPGKELYADYHAIEQLAKAYREGFVLSGDYVQFRKKKYGASSAGVEGSRFVVFSENHDQAGNRAHGERLSMLIDFDKLRLASAAVMLGPYIPMLFMGEEYGEQNPFLFFVDFKDVNLIDSVRAGRHEQLKRFKSNGDLPNPQDVNTFRNSKLHWQLRDNGKHRLLLNWYEQLITLRKSRAALKNSDKDGINVSVLNEKSLVIHRTDSTRTDHVLTVLNFSSKPIEFNLPDFADWEKLLDSTDDQLTQSIHALPDKLILVDRQEIKPFSVHVFANH